MRNQTSSSETQHSVALATWVAINLPMHPDLKFFTHIPNGGLRDRRTVTRKGRQVTYSPTGALLKRMGLRRGLLDYMLIARRGPYCGLAFELKSQSGSYSDEQADWAEQLCVCGFHVPGPFCCWEVASREVLAYLALAPSAVS